MMLIVLGGCTASELPQFNPGWVLDEHGNPEFKPKDFGDAIEMLKSEFEEISSSRLGRDRQERVQVYQQVIRWLPEFAADTDIGRGEWEEVDRRSKELLLDSSRSDFFSESGRESLARLLDELAGKIPPDRMRHGEEQGRDGK